MSESHENQSLLVVTDEVDQAFIIGVRGEKAFDLISNLTPPCVGDVPGNLDVTFNETPGFQVWEGAIFDMLYAAAKDTVTSYRWEGVWRPATLADFKKFGVPLPTL